MADTVALAWRQFRLERRMFWRNPTAAFFNFALPLLLLVLLGTLYSGDQENLDILIPGIAGMSIVTTTFVALSHNLVFLREQGVLKRLRGTPMPTSAYLGGVFGNAVANAAIQLAIVLAAGRFFYGIGWPEHWAALAVFAVAGVVCFGALGVALSHAIPNFEATPAYVNAVFLPLIFISGVFYDADQAPTFLRDIAQALPLVHLIDGLSAAMLGGASLGDNLSNLAVVALWAAVALALAIRGFRWEARRD